MNDIALAMDGGLDAFVLITDNLDSAKYHNIKPFAIGGTRNIFRADSGLSHLQPSIGLDFQFTDNMTLNLGGKYSIGFAQEFDDHFIGSVGLTITF